MAKKISAIVSLVIIGALIIATLIMANIKVDYSIKCATPDYVDIYTTSSANRRVNAEEKAKIVEYISNASNTNALKALFEGKLGKKAELKLDSVKGKTLPSATKENFQIKYVYENPQNLKDGNSNFLDEEGNTYSYYELVFEMKQTEEGEVETTVYVIPKESEPNKYTYKYTVTADLSDLYNYVVDNGLNA